ncbi:arsenate reductase ArsC [Bosea thiooxidans]|nr:arsenate reductase ArsC [Bosea sp. (in: a-proteobacteria)]
MARAPLNVLFVCTGNSARSIMAEAIIGRIAPGKFKGYSAGSDPREEINPFAARLLKSLNFDVTQFEPKSWEQFAKVDAPPLDFVFTLCDDAANEPCPHWPGQPMSAHWGLPDPAAFVGEDVQKALAFADAYRMLNNRISIFSNLPLASLERVALQHRLDAIGTDPGMKDDAA